MAEATEDFTSTCMEEIELHVISSCLLEGRRSKLGSPFNSGLCQYGQNSKTRELDQLELSCKLLKHWFIRIWYLKKSVKFLRIFLLFFFSCFTFLVWNESWFLYYPHHCNVSDLSVNLHKHRSNSCLVFNVAKKCRQFWVSAPGWKL